MSRWAALWDNVRSVVLGLAIAFIISTAAIASYYIPSESMVPNLLVGDRLFVSKFPYGYSHYSIMGNPPLFQGRIFEREIARGDIAVFKTPQDNTTDLIKRIVGLPGDTIEMRHGVLVINDVPVPRERIEDLTYRAPGGEMRTVRRFRETLPNGKSYVTVDTRDGGQADNVGPFHVPAGNYFAMGDNRDNSLDSRWPSNIGVGFVPAENVVGRAEFIAWSLSGEGQWRHPATWAHALRGARSFTSLR